MRSAGTPCADLPPATAHALLGNERRLAAAVAVAEADRPLSPADLATLLAAREIGTGPGGVPPPIRGRFRAVLEDDHLPSLEEHDVLEATPEGYRPGPNLPGLVAAAEAAWEHLCPGEPPSRR